MANEVFLDISRNEHERARLLSEYKYQLDIQSKLVDAEREGEQRATVQRSLRTILEVTL